ncbi:hypothetical protein BDP27DRAFT_1450800 [Rhodocollybia butyracea]|uniref:Zinc finger protein n=1 Tax=Rhodocollybia butyracea TaxID=206335 RepID=A0A9P5PLQ1_9AGAR|nr:hypothetical protein BDP27DRAFT_1450800 [Rhodocollybia butyracea]
MKLNHEPAVTAASLPSIDEMFPSIPPKRRLELLKCTHVEEGRSVAQVLTPQGRNRTPSPPPVNPHSPTPPVKPKSNVHQDERSPNLKKKYICTKCSKGFSRPSSLRLHINVHTGNTPYRCSFPGCGREFNVSSNMRRHYRRHNRPS